MSLCKVCPRRCQADREQGSVGFCGADNRIFAARAALHLWEEPCISGVNGSGAVFFSGCALRCVYCQNHEIASMKVGREITEQRLVRIFLELQEKGAENINLVTPSHYVCQLIPALRKAKKLGLYLPIVYNCSGYESVESLRLLSGMIDIYLTDFKYMDERTAARYSKAPDYPRIAKAALEEMVQQTGSAEFSADGMMKRGVIVRHLLLPGHVREAKAVVEYVYRTYGEKVYLSLMNQFTPFERLKETYPEIARKVTKREYNALLEYVLDLGVEQAYFQEGETAKESFIPAFNYEGI